jgi:hypothetical protein
MAEEGIQRCHSWFTPVVVSTAITGFLVLAPCPALATSADAGAGTQDASAARASTPERQTARSSAGKATGASHTVRLRSRAFAPDVTTPTWIDELQRLRRNDRERIHLLVQLGTIPDSAERGNLEALGLALLAYVPEHTWIASFPADDPARIATLPGVVWAGELTVDDKLDTAIKNGLWGSWSLAPDGTAAVFIAMHRDERLDVGRALVAATAGRVVGEVAGINLLVAEMPLVMVRSLAGDDAVQWIEPAGMPLEPVNDGSRAFINVDVLQGAPYNLDGTSIDALVYDSGQVGDHLDFGARLIHGDADTVSDHSTHVAGILGGDGSASAAHGGTALQWRGMAPNVDLISFGTEGYTGSGVIFYEDVPDIENDWAAGQNSYGADLVNASLGSNIYNNYYPTGCSVMGLYGASSVLIDQIVRGGNSAVGIGDRYIAAWAVGNETGWGTSCGTYGTIAPPASAKNPIHVGGANTDNGALYAHSSWGPTADGRVKPTVTAGACQVSGDFGVTSTDNSPVDGYTVKCGTSMATPAVSGGIALMLEQYRDEYGTSGNFWPSTAKAILIQTAVDYGNAGPDYQWGYGNVDMQAAVDLITRRAFRQEAIAVSEVDEFSFDVAGTADDVVVSLAWDDHEATLNADPTLVNDLDLELIAPDGSTWRPWILDPANPTDPAARGVNTVDNQEQVLVPAASVTTGMWLARVAGTTVPQSPQEYSLACEGCAANQHASLIVAVSPSGSGTVSGSGIACEGDCWEVYALNATVVLTADAAPGFAFDSWTGCDSPAGASCTMTMSTDKTVAANFQPIATLDVVIAPAGGGTVTGSGINCPGDCSETYPLNTAVALDAVANVGYAFDSWTGCDSPAGASCTMIMDADKTATANFRAVAVLVVVVSPHEGGSVTGVGIDCPTDCSEVFDLGATVELTAVADPTYHFIQWLGCDSTTDTVCTVTMDIDTTVTAQFATNVPTASPVGLAILAVVIALSGFALLRRIS